MTILFVILSMVVLIILYNVLCNIDTELGSKNKYINENDVQYEEESINDTMIVIEYCVIRREPRENSEKISNCNKGDRIKVISKLSNNWYKVKSNNKIGYIKDDYLKSSDEVFIDTGGIVISSVKADGTIELDGDVSTNILNYAYNYWYLIPENIRKDFSEQGWKIVITDKSLSKELDIAYGVSGVTLPKENKILIYGSQSCIRYALVHEIGHYIDFRNNFVSRSDAFKEIYKSNGNKILEYNSNYIQASYSEEEYFAELYRAYVLGDYKIKFMLSNDIEFVLNHSNNIGAVYKDKVA